ncbi:MAG: hypothetical protein PHY14_01930 [Candidatus Gracilibacteria bacterium]|nr:hypothetical protein [Candidatus Gracilibacteria bacterium]
MKKIFIISGITISLLSSCTTTQQNKNPESNTQMQQNGTSISGSNISISVEDGTTIPANTQP